MSVHTIATTVVDRWSNRPWADLVLAAMLIAVMLAASLLGLVIVTDPDQRNTLYATTAAAAGALLAFVVVPGAIIWALAPHERVRAVLEAHGDDLGRATVAAGLESIAAMVGAVVAVGLDGGPVSRPATRYAVAGLLCAAVLGATRVLELFRVVMSAHAQDQVDPVSPREPQAPKPRTLASVRGRGPDSAAGSTLENP